ncbi:MAG: septum site-determining protein MinD [Candidatus Aenigmarchaeota archaeon ex4484_56]|nr:MAG: septum site-determining protein MinD [Candidatus Aenigmarchaeota archaeon ex4484_56]
MVNTRIIGIISGKGGVGKTTLTFNLGAALTDFNKNVVVIDGNLTTPNLGIHAGIPLYPISLHDVLKGKVDIFDVMHILPNGLKIIPSSINLNDLKGVNPEYLSTHLVDLIGKLDYVLIDGAPGLGNEAISILKASNEIIGITTPELPALTDLLKSVKLSEASNKKYLGTVINKVRNKKYEPKKEHIETLLEGTKILEFIPEDENIRHALHKKLPVVHHKPYSKASIKIKSIAAKLSDRELKIPWYKKIFG